MLRLNIPEYELIEKEVKEIDNWQRKMAAITAFGWLLTFLLTYGYMSNQELLGQKMVTPTFYGLLAIFILLPIGAYFIVKARCKRVKKRHEELLAVALKRKDDLVRKASDVIYQQQYPLSKSTIEVTVNHPGGQGSERVPGLEDFQIAVSPSATLPAVSFPDAHFDLKTGFVKWGEDLFTASSI